MRRFPTRLFAAGLAVAVGYFAAALLAPPAGQRAPSAAAGPAPASPVKTAGVSLPVEGDALVLRVLDNLERRPNVAAKIRQTTRLDRETLAGAGVYWQQGVENLRRTHWRLQTASGDAPSAFTQVFTGQELWLDRRVRDQRKVTRVDVGRVVRELNLAEGAGSWARPRRESADSPVVLARGGMSQLVAELRRCFHFSAPREVQWEGVPSLAMIGRWRPEELERTWPGLGESARGWPAHLPHHVVLVVGAADLFPRLVEYRRGSQASLAGEESSLALSADPLARFEFFDINFAAAMPRGAFEFAAVDVDWRDVTGRVVERLRAHGKLAAKETRSRK